MPVLNYEKEIPLSTSAPGAQFQAAALNVNKDQSKGLQQGSLVTSSLQRRSQFNKRSPNLENICSRATESAAGLQLSSDLFWTLKISVTVAWLCAQRLERYKHSGVLFCLDLFQNTLSLHHFIWVGRFAAHLHMLSLVKTPLREVCLKHPSSLATESEVAGGCLKRLGPFLWLFSEKLLLNFKIKIMLHKRAFPPPFKFEMKM